MSRTYRKSSPMRDVEFEARRQGQTNRATTWSPNGDKKDKKAERRNAKRQCQDLD